MDLEFKVVDERVMIQNWLGFDELLFFYGYLIEKESEVLGF